MRFYILLYLLFLNLSSFSQTIIATGQLNVPRWFHQSQILPNGKVLVFGGDNGNYIPGNDVVYKSSEIYDPISQSWTYTSDMNKARIDFASIILNDGNVLAIGGNNGDISNVTASCEMYNLATGTWSNIDSMNFPKAYIQAVKLLDGRVLVIGPSCEIYDPQLNTWTITGSLTIEGTQGSAVLLKDGRVLVTGGIDTDALKRAEIFDPSTGIWTLLSNEMIYERKDHSSVLMEDGKVLIYGSNGGVIENFNSAEIFDPATLNFTAVPSMSQYRANSPGILMDNGNVLAFGIGDLFTPSDTKLIEVFNPVSNTWSSNVYNQTGTQAYRIHKLHSGKILVIGGSYTTGNGASQGCALIDQGISPCTSPNLNLTVSGSVICFGNSSNITVAATEADVEYKVSIGDIFFSDWTVGGGDLSLPIDGNNLMAGKNVVKVEARKTGCPTFILNDTAIVNTMQVVSQPTIISNSPTTFCQGDSVTLSGPNGFSSYLWSNGATSQSVKIKATGLFSVRVMDGSGCKSAWSNPLEIIIKPVLPVSAGSDQIVCEYNPSFSLSDYSPLEGSWTGIGVSTTGVFDPSLAGVGSHILTYTYCNVSSSKIIQVDSLVIPSVSVTISSGTNPVLENDPLELSAIPINGGLSPSYSWKLNHQIIGTNSNQFSSSNFQDKDTLICEMTSSILCANPLITKDTLVINVITRPQINSVNLLSNPDKIRIIFSESMDSSIETSSAIKIWGSMTGEYSGSISGGSTTTIDFTPTISFKSGERIFVTVTTNCRSINNISIVKAKTFEFVNSASVAPATFNSNTNLISGAYNPNCLYSADFNEDGKIDVVTANKVSNNASILINDGTGTLIFSSNVAVGSVPVSIHSSDFNGDKSMDIAVANSNSNSVSIRYNNGSGGFTGTTEVGVGNYPCSVISADLDQDGDIDLATANLSSRNVSIRYNDGLGNFSGTYNITVPLYPEYLYSADIDSDGDIDLVTVNSNSNSISIIKNLGVNSFTVANLNVGTKPICVYGGDLDGDGDIDLVTGNAGEGKAAILKNDGVGTFTLFNKVSLGLNPISILTSDLDGDNDLDIISCSDNWQLSIRFNNGMGSFSGSNYMPFDYSTRSVTTADFDMDGDMDIAVSALGSTSSYIQVLLNLPIDITTLPLSKSEFCAGSELKIDFKISGISYSGNQFTAELSDINGNFISPIVLGTNTSTPITGVIPTGVLEGTGYRIRVVSSDPSIIGSDNGTDLFITNDCPQIVYTSPLMSEKNVELTTDIRIDFSHSMRNKVASDTCIKIYGSMTGFLSTTGSFSGGNSNAINFNPLDSFRPGEIITTIVTNKSENVSGISILKPYIYKFRAEVSPAPQNYKVIKWLPTTGFPGRVHGGDLDKDGDIDLINTDYYYKKLSIRFNDGNGDFTDVVNMDLNYPLASTNYPLGLEVCDVDADEDLDILIANINTNNIFIKVNNGSGIFDKDTLIYGGFVPRNIYTEDFDGDGDMDLITGSTIGLVVDKNDGKGGFWNFEHFNGGNELEGIFPVDIDLDGDIDVIAASLSDDKVLIKLNSGECDFSDYDEFQVGIKPWSIYSEDLNGDGFPDFVTANYGSNNVSILFNDGNMNFIRTDISVGSNPFYVTCEDYDGDGDIDIATANYYSNNISILYNDGMGGYNLRKDFSVGGRPNCIFSSDLNSDRKLEIIVSNESGTISILGDPALDVINGSTSSISSVNDFIVYPVPFDKTFNISYSINRQEKVILEVYDLLGRKKETIVNKELSMGRYQYSCEILTAGFYTIKLKVGDSIYIKKVHSN